MRFTTLDKGSVPQLFSIGRVNGDQMEWDFAEKGGVTVTFDLRTRILQISKDGDVTTYEPGYFSRPQKAPRPSPKDDDSGPPA